LALSSFSFDLRSVRKIRLSRVEPLAPIYRGLAGQGLIARDYLNGETGTGGVYLWRAARRRSLVYRARMAELTSVSVFAPGSPGDHDVTSTI